MSQAVDLYRGPFLEDLTLRDAPEFELWLLGERARTQQLYEKGMLTLIGRHIQLKDYSQAITRAQQLLQANALLETVHTQLIWLYAHIGQRDSALQQFERCQTFQGGIRVFGFDGVWGTTRPVWNQLNYHITNINDDLSVPFSEANSWEVHNTYRAQTDLTNPLPNYGVVLTHTAAISGVTVLTGTFNVPPSTQAAPVFGWEYGQNGTNPTVTRTFQSLVAGLLPGETRLVAESSQVTYSLAGGSNNLALPPLYVTAARLAGLEPAAQTGPVGSTAVYTLTLTNPAPGQATYAITVDGPLAAWTAAPATVVVPGAGQVTVPLTVTIPAGAPAGTLPLLLTVDDGNVSDNATADLTVFDGLDVGIDPANQQAQAGQTVTYTLTITNLETVDRNYTVTASGLAGVSLPGSFFVPAGQAVAFPFTAGAGQVGPQPFTLLVVDPTSGAAASTDAVVDVQSGSAVALALGPNPAQAGPGSTAALTLTVTNTGNRPDSFDLDVDVPAGWSWQLLINGRPANSVTLPPAVYNSQELTLLITPALGVAPGDYDVTASAVAHSSNAIAASVTGTVQVLDRGVQIAILSGPATVDPRDTAVWQVRVINTGQLAGTFDLLAAGPLAGAGTFSASSVTLAAGQSQTVSFMADDLEQFLPGTYELVVAAQSQANSIIISQDRASVMLTAYEAIEAAFEPLSQTVTNTLTATFMLVITNTGNFNTFYQLSSNVPGASSSLAVNDLQLPAHGTAQILLTVSAPGPDTYVVTGTALSASGAAGTSTNATLIIPGEPPPPQSGTVYLPMVWRP